LAVKHTTHALSGPLVSKRRVIFSIRWRHKGLYRYGRRCRRHKYLAIQSPLIGRRWGRGNHLTTPKCNPMPRDGPDGTDRCVRGSGPLRQHGRASASVPVRLLASCCVVQHNAHGPPDPPQHELNTSARATRRAPRARRFQSLISQSLDAGRGCVAIVS
jgi:hypothetical protein